MRVNKHDAFLPLHEITEVPVMTLKELSMENKENKDERYLSQCFSRAWAPQHQLFFPFLMSFWAWATYLWHQVEGEEFRVLESRVMAT